VYSLFTKYDSSKGRMSSAITGGYSAAFAVRLSLGEARAIEVWVCDIRCLFKLVRQLFMFGIITYFISRLPALLKPMRFIPNCSTRHATV
jgi:hypothetical protein